MDKIIKPLKKYKLGFETEFFIIEQDGSISDRADELIAKVREKHPKIPIEEEYTHHMIEIVTNPYLKIVDCTKEWLRDISKIMEVADKLELKLYPYGTYPGYYEPKTRDKEVYKVLEDIKGVEISRFSSGHVSGFHLHYCLPYGTFDKKDGGLKSPYESKNKDLLISMHNCLIAADPALTSFMASSPFVDSEHHAMDMRTLLYRDIVHRGSKKIVGQFYGTKMFGALPEYASGISELSTRVELMQKEFMEHTKEKFPHLREAVRDKHAYSFFWGPIRITRYGTIEYRGMDMNLPSYFISVSKLIKRMMQRIMEDELRILPSDTGLRKPFHVEGNIIHVPPRTQVADILQKKACIEGTDCHEIRDYMKELVNFALRGKRPAKEEGFSEIAKVLDTGKTRSDIILKKAVEFGWTRDRPLKDETSKKLALWGAKEMEDEVQLLLEKELVIDMEEEE